MSKGNIELLHDLTGLLMDDKCQDLVLLTLVDRLCRRNWSDIDRGWVRWAFYMERLLGDPEDYKTWAKDNCER